MSVVIPAAGQVYRRLRFLNVFGTQTREHLLISRQPSAPFAESFRLLAINMRTMLGTSPRRGVVVVSAYPGDGRSLVAANLAIALAEQDRVLLVDGRGEAAGPRRALSEMFLTGSRLNRDGLPAALHGVLLETNQPQVYMMPRTEPALSPEGELNGAVEEASAAGMYAVLDSPPALSSSDAFLLAQKVGNVLYVVRRKLGDMEEHRRVKDQLERLGANVLGIVVNEF